jgi:hypothetical protein
MIDWSAFATPPRTAWYSLQARIAQVDRAKSREDHDFWATELYALDRAYFLSGLVNHEGEGFDNRRIAT